MGDEDVYPTQHPARPYQSGHESSPRAVAVGILKGGVGKSTVSVNLARQLADHGHTVLFIDWDPNGHASSGLGFNDHYHNMEPTIADCFFDTAEASSLIYQTEFGFDILPSNNELATVERELIGGNLSQPYQLLKEHVVTPLLAGEYEHIVIDLPAYRSRLTDNALVAAENLILPLSPGSEVLSGLERTIDRQIAPLRQHIPLDILALVPNMLSMRIDQQTKDRRLLEQLNSLDTLQNRVPNFARIASWDPIDAGEYKPSVGIRERASIANAYGEQQPLLDYDPECDQLVCFDELAHIVEVGGVVRPE
jgi:chromosome partitioning protein